MSTKAYFAEEESRSNTSSFTGVNTTTALGSCTSEKTINITGALVNI